MRLSKLIPSPQHITVFQYSLNIARIIFWSISLVILCYWAIYEEIISHFQNGDIPVIRGTIEREVLPPPCAYVCGMAEYLDSIQVHIRDLEKKQCTLQNSNNTLRPMTQQEKKKAWLVNFKNSEKCIVFIPDNSMSNLFTRSGPRHNIILDIFWKPPGQSSSVMSPAAEYLFGLYSCNNVAGIDENVIPYHLTIPSLNTFTFSVNEYYDSKTEFPLGRSRTEVVFKRQSILTLGETFDDGNSSQIIFSPEGYCTTVEQFIISPWYNMLVSLGSAGGYVKWAILISFILFGNNRLRKDGLIHYAYKICGKKEEFKTQDERDDEINFLIGERFKEFEDKLSKDYLANIKFDFNQDLDSEDSSHETEEDVHTSDPLRGPMNVIRWDETLNRNSGD